MSALKLLNVAKFHVSVKKFRVSHHSPPSASAFRLRAPASGRRARLALQLRVAASQRPAASGGQGAAFSSAFLLGRPTPPLPRRGRALAARRSRSAERGALQADPQAAVGQGARRSLNTDAGASVAGASAVPVTGKQTATAHRRPGKSKLCGQRFRPVRLCRKALRRNIPRRLAPEIADLSCSRLSELNAR